MSMILAPAVAEVKPAILAPGAALETLAALADRLAEAGRIAECHAVESAWSDVAADDGEYDAWLGAHADELAEDALAESAYGWACQVGHLAA